MRLLLLAALLLAAEARANPFVDLFSRLGPMPGASWKAVSFVPLYSERHPTFHPQGIKLLGSRLFLTTVEGRSAGHLLEFQLDSSELPREARVLGDLTFDPGAEGNLVHAGGFDGDENHLYIPLAAYRAEGPARILEVDPTSLQYHSIAWLNDHVGTLAFDKDEQRFQLVDWSTGLYTLPFTDLDFSREIRHVWKKRELGGDWEYQDCKSVGEGYALCSAKSPGFFPAGEIHLVSFRDGFSVLHRVPVPRLKGNGEPGGMRPLTYNAMDVALLRAESGEPVGLRFFFVPHDDEDSHLMVYDARPEGRVELKALYK